MLTLAQITVNHLINKETKCKNQNIIFLYVQFRGTEAKGKCIKKESMQLIPYMEEELADRGMNAMVSSPGV